MEQHQPGVDQEEIDTLQNLVGQQLPEDFQLFYRTVNGDDPNKASLGIFPSADSFDEMAYGPLAISQIKKEWGIQKELLEDGDFEGIEPEQVDEGIREGCWNPGWIPFAGNGGGDLYCIDMDPAEGGTSGQVISHNHETCDHLLLGSSLTDYLTKLAGRLAGGELEFNDSDGIVEKDQ